MENSINDSDGWIRSSDSPLTGFSWKRGSKRDTNGVLMWSDVFLYTNDDGEDIAIILVDTQGLFNTEVSNACI